MLFGITFCVVSHDPAHSCPTGPRIPLGPPSSDRLDTTDGQKANSCSRDSPEKLTKEQRLARLARGPYEGVPRRRRGAAVRAAEAPGTPDPPESEIAMLVPSAGLSDTPSPLTRAHGRAEAATSRSRTGWSQAPAGQGTHPGRAPLSPGHASRCSATRA